MKLKRLQHRDIELEEKERNIETAIKKNGQRVDEVYLLQKVPSIRSIRAIHLLSQNHICQTFVRAHFE